MEKELILKWFDDNDRPNLKMIRMLFFFKNSGREAWIKPGCSEEIEDGLVIVSTVRVQTRWQLS